MCRSCGGMKRGANTSRKTHLGQQREYKNNRKTMSKETGGEILIDRCWGCWAGLEAGETGDECQGCERDCENGRQAR